jgi:hypothetical protein
MAETGMPTLQEARKGRMEGVLPATVVESGQPGGDPFHLVACRSSEDTRRNWFGGKERRFHWWYVSAESVESLERELAGLADFGALPTTRKMAARLELLASKAFERNFQKLSVDAFEVVDEPMTAIGEAAQDGCGFIPYSILAKLLHSTKASKRGPEPTVLAVQVRVLAPSLGFFKGVLMVKRGIQRVQLTPSMVKVPASQHPDPTLRDSAIIVIKQVCSYTIPK